jgi:aspartyl-tRNA(Asn)/glutamyl-tRNA(Gln) amidotransferase subunit A
MTQLHDMTVAQLAQALQTKQASAVEVATAFLARAGGNPHNSFLDINSEVTLAQAQASDARIAAGTKTCSSPAISPPLPAPRF